ncbi:hypothetical protein TIFTF001_006439 [Ficus carica]|uniref:Glycosyl hydrolase family 32 C-terminal domain-containing protein n=1 Tax=Ficus carica TaxID=3494 RepID=A0AA87ZNZ7_FICCA|nr:hypothetical protein TIFTF001_006439 [Ficus carica]
MRLTNNINNLIELPFTSNLTTCGCTVCAITRDVKSAFGTTLSPKQHHLRCGNFTSLKRNNEYVVLMCSDQSWSSLNQENDKTAYGAYVDVNPVHENLSLRSLIDHSKVESFDGEGKASITARVYPTLAIDDEGRLYVLNNGPEPVKISSLNAWSMETVEIK